MPWRVSFEMRGKQFTPSRVPFQFTEQHDPGGEVGTVGRYRGQPLPYGSATYLVPPTIPNADRLRHVVHMIEPVLPAIRAAGATDCHISIARYYYAQCNEEYSLEELQLIARLGCGFIYSAYSMTENEEREMEKTFENIKPVVQIGAAATYRPGGTG